MIKVLFKSLAGSGWLICPQQELELLKKRLIEWGLTFVGVEK